MLWITGANGLLGGPSRNVKPLYISLFGYWTRIGYHEFDRSAHFCEEHNPGITHISQLPPPFSLVDAAETRREEAFKANVTGPAKSLTYWLKKSERNSSMFLPIMFFAGDLLRPLN